MLISRIGTLILLNTVTTDIYIAKGYKYIKNGWILNTMDDNNDRGELVNQNEGPF